MHCLCEDEQISAEGILDVLFSLHKQALLSDALLLTPNAMTLGISLPSISLFFTMSRYAERLYELRLFSLYLPLGHLFAVAQNLLGT